jgi:hypothetical protein
MKAKTTVENTSIFQGIVEFKIFNQGWQYNDGGLYKLVTDEHGGQAWIFECAYHGRQTVNAIVGFLRERDDSRDYFINNYGFAE